jgi:hypothetical protein
VTQERAVPAGGCFWGMQDLIRKLPGVLSTKAGSLAAMCRTRPITTMAHTPRRLRSSLTPRSSATVSCLSSSFKHTTRQPTIGKATTSEPTIDRPSTRPARRRRAWPTRRSPTQTRLACGRACRDRGRSCRSVLAGRTWGPVLPGAPSARLHLPFHATRVEAPRSGPLDKRLTS